MKEVEIKEFRNKYELMNRLDSENKKEIKRFQMKYGEELMNEAVKGKNEKLTSKLEKLRQEKKESDVIELLKRDDKLNRLIERESKKSMNEMELMKAINKRNQVKYMQEEEKKHDLQDAEFRNRLLLKNQDDYRSKLNSMNNRIYEHGQQQLNYLESMHSPKIPKEPFNVREDYNFNHKKIELHEDDKVMNKREAEIGVKERLENLRKYYEDERKIRELKHENQNTYKSLLDQQRSVHKDLRIGNFYTNQTQSAEKNIKNREETLVMPSYTYLNKPIPSNKKAYDGLGLLKRSIDISRDTVKDFFGENKNINVVPTYYQSHLKTEESSILRNSKNPLKHNNQMSKREINIIDNFQWESKLARNPILTPCEDIHYNKYIDKERINLSKYKHLETIN